LLQAIQAQVSVGVNIGLSIVISGQYDEDMNLRRRVVYREVPLFMKITDIMMMVDGDVRRYKQGDMKEETSWEMAW
jgi:hypothetical protein